MRMFNRGLARTGLALALMAGLSAPALAQTDAVDFGDDSSEWANDGECDDPRFVGAGMAVELIDADLRRDASDCRAAFEAGTIALAEEHDGAADAMAAAAAAIDFGDDSSEWARDQECDDPRFAGPGMTSEPQDIDIGRDASDCRQAFADGTIALAEEEPPAAPPVAPPAASPAAPALELLAARIDFGDDGGSWPHDGDCDDPDFTGIGAVSGGTERDRKGDASDCRAAFLAGTVALKSADDLGGVFDYGDDSSKWADDGECDDWRFGGAGMSKKLLAADVMADASDCRALEAAGQVSIKPVFQPDYALGAPYDGSAIDFGDDSSPYAEDGQCDDPRFEGPGVAGVLLDSDLKSDATDCRAAFEEGRAALS
ncbi:hypothetical protein ACFOOL_04290 [Devosia honganensis]|uniref:Uncharacterized protein n=1 Tax=Devosia honganensis TaxID=1610527 RepID=A0ABV7X082_9HYPH